MALSGHWPRSCNLILMLYLFVALASERCLSWASPLEVALTTEIDIETEDTGVSPSAPSMPAQRTHEVAVSPAGRYVFDPPFIEAAIGEFITFSFLSGNHTVTESTFKSPCSPRGAFDTNFFNSMPYDKNKSEVTLMVDSDNPRWFHCRQHLNGSHCERGMVFAINPGRFWHSFLARVGNTTVAKTSASNHIPSYGLPTRWPYEPHTGPTEDLDLGLGPTPTMDSESAEGPMTMTVATTTSTLHPDSRWMTQTFTTTFRAES